METESVGSVAGVQRPRSTLRRNALGEELTLRDAFPVNASPLDRTACKKKGHLSPDFPKNDKAGPGTPDQRGSLERQCPCGRGPCVVRTSKTEKNPGRPFYACPGKFEASCHYFSWCDKADQPFRFGIPLELNQQNALNSPLKQHGGYKSPTKPYGQIDTPEPPLCACGAGKCRYLKMENGINAGLRYFGCTIKKGQGACNFIQWIDTPNPVTPSAKDIHLEKNIKSVPEKPTACQIGQNMRQNLLSPNKVQNLRIGAAGTNGRELEPMPIDVPDDTETPVSPKRLPGELGLCSPVKRLNLHQGVAGTSKSGRCFRCGKEGHWAKECVQPRSPCF
ncbi:uncharacterized protein LOC121984476 isoform X1 [Zingiber officinale]|uniref:Uncharacterized protein n=1 Tax=Zingiber officinale TaxID=94328 RepID=A0A8J5G9K3_ZINOF|nr:uncharacterized protein LOC121984476 isoform X1 [Zingiber officinale]KAG6503418.1 hypothetical protein ZIOFF_035731 [Zingiber officinale]